MFSVNPLDKSKKRVQKILCVFTETLEQLGKEKEQLNKFVTDNNEFIEQARTQNEEATLEIAKIEGVIGNIQKIVKG